MGSLSEEVKHKVGEVSAAQLQDVKYTFSAENVMKNWGILAGFILLYILVGFIFLKQVDRDKR